MRMVTAIGAMLLAGCATTGRGGPDDGAAAPTIRYETSPCFGTCPVYAVTVRPDGSGTFEGQRFTAVDGVRTFQAGADGYRRFAALLAPYRPALGETLVRPGTPACGNAPTDMPGVDVRWTGQGGEQHLSFYDGCRDAAMRAALRAAPEALPIAGFIRAAAAPR